MNIHVCTNIMYAEYCIGRYIISTGIVQGISIPEYNSRNTLSASASFHPCSPRTKRRQCCPNNAAQL